MNMPQPSRGEIWHVDLDPVQGHEQGRRRPAVIVSADSFNQGPGAMVVIVPITGTIRRLPYEVIVNPPEGGLTKASCVRCDNVRSISVLRLGNKLGAVSPRTLLQIELRLRALLNLPRQP